MVIALLAKYFFCNLFWVFYYMYLSPMGQICRVGSVSSLRIAFWSSFLPGNQQLVNFFFFPANRVYFVHNKQASSMSGLDSLVIYSTLLSFLEWAPECPGDWALKRWRAEEHFLGLRSPQATTGRCRVKKVGTSAVLAIQDTKSLSSYSPQVVQECLE
jgi:hypothetical protein